MSAWLVMPPVHEPRVTSLPHRRRLPSRIPSMPNMDLSYLCLPVGAIPTVLRLEGWTEKTGAPEHTSTAEPWKELNSPLALASYSLFPVPSLLGRADIFCCQTWKLVVLC